MKNENLDNNLDINIVFFALMSVLKFRKRKGSEKTINMATMSIFKIFKMVPSVGKILQTLYDIHRVIQTPI